MTNFVVTIMFILLFIRGNVDRGSYLLFADVLLVCLSYSLVKCSKSYTIVVIICVNKSI